MKKERIHVIGSAIIIVILLWFVLPVCAETELFEYTQSSVSAQTLPCKVEGAQNYEMMIVIPDCANYTDITEFIYRDTSGYNSQYVISGGSGVANFRVYPGNPSVNLSKTLGYGYVTVEDDAGGDILHFEFSSLDMSGYSWVELRFDWTGAESLAWSGSGKRCFDSGGSPSLIAGMPYFFMGSGTFYFAGYHETTFSTKQKAYLTTECNNETGHINVTLQRVIDGVSYGSFFEELEYPNLTPAIYTNTFGTTNISTSTIEDMARVKIGFGFPTTNQEYIRILDGCQIFSLPDITPENDLTVTVTATPTPRPAYCGYWTVTPANTTIFRGQNVTYTLTESDPNNAFARIDYYKILPNGQKVADMSYVKDNYGLFGFGVTWVKNDPITDIVSSSSEAAAKAHTMWWFNASGKNYAQIDILDDKSFLGAIGIHDWQIVCSILVDVNVGGPSWIPPPFGPDGLPDTGDEPEIDPGPDGIEGTPDDILPDEYYAQIGINVWEMDTKAVVYGTTINVYDFATGEWTNKSNGAGGATTYFYVTPLRNIRIYVDKSPWVVYDQTINVPNPPGTYGVYLKRPMTPTGSNTSFVVFAVKASEKLFPLSGASIKISNATWNSTIVTNSAGGTQIELPEGETYNYLINRYGYLKVSDYFDVPVDDLYKTVTMNVDPSAPPTYPSPTWTEIIIKTGTPTPTPANQGGVSPIGTGTQYRANNLESGINIWYDRFAFLQELFFLVVVVGALGLMMKSIPGGGGRRRK